MDSEAFDFLAELERDEVNSQSNDSLVPPGQRECPICKRPMLVEVESGVHVDVCNDHGVWLDRGELPAIISRIRSGARISRTAAIRRAKREGKLSGAMFGIWALLFD